MTHQQWQQQWLQRVFNRRMSIQLVAIVQFNGNGVIHCATCPECCWNATRLIETTYPHMISVFAHELSLTDEYLMSLN